MKSLVRYNPAHWSLDHDSFFNQMDNFFRDTFEEIFDDPKNSSLSLFERSGYPRLDIRNETDKVVVDVEVPGLSKEDVKVEVNEGILVVRGDKRNEINEKKSNWIRRELKRSSFSRQVCTLNDNCDVDKIEATFKDGILTINIPKKQPDTIKQPKQIEVK